MSPRVTLAFISFNRLYYLRAALESARECIRYPNLEWIVADGDSVEPGLREYLQSCSWLDHLIVRPCSHADAMNDVVARASSEFLLLWPDDVQFVARGDWMADFVEILSLNADIGSLGLDFQRRCTLDARLQPPLWPNRGDLLAEIRRYGSSFRRQRVCRSSRDARIHTFGWTMPGICGSGIPSLTRTSVWRELGPWRTSASADTANIVDSSLGAEDDMVARFYASKRPLQMAIPEIAVAADILTDPTGCKAKVRGGYRYGEYWPPPDGPFYYRIRDWSSYAPHSGGMPLSFMEGVEPLGFSIPVDAQGERKKSSINESVREPITTA